uniref:Putative secreted protein n=1 Tax=Ixodes ricinus TaxID=34613 RepID=A0A147BFX0_IXORI
MGLLPPVSALGLEFLDWALALLGQAHLDFLLVRWPISELLDRLLARVRQLCVEALPFLGSFLSFGWKGFPVAVVFSDRSYPLGLLGPLGLPCLELGRLLELPRHSVLSVLRPGRNLNFLERLLAVFPKLETNLLPELLLGGLEPAPLGLLQVSCLLVDQFSGLLHILLNVAQLLLCLLFLQNVLHLFFQGGYLLAVVRNHLLRQYSLLDSSLGLLDNFLEQLPLLFTNHRHRPSTFASTCRTTHTVHIVLHRMRQCEVDHGLDVLDVEAARNQVGGDEDVHLKLLEAVQGLQPLGLVQVPVQLVRTHAQESQQHAQPVGQLLGLYKHDCVVMERPADQCRQDGLPVAFPLWPDADELLPQVECHVRVVVEEQLDWLLQRNCREVFNLLGHCRREQHCLPRWGALPNDLLHLLRKCVIQHSERKRKFQHS